VSEGVPEAPGGGKRLFGMPRNVVIIGGVAFAATILYLWWKNRANASANQGTSATGQGQQAFTTSGIDYSGELSVIQSELEELLAAQPAGSSSGGGWTSGGGWDSGGQYNGGWGNSSSSYGNWDSGTGQGQNSNSNGNQGSPGSNNSSSPPATSGGTRTTTGSTTTSSNNSNSNGYVGDTTQTALSNGVPPGPSGGRVASKTNTGLTFAWNATPNAASYRVTLTGPGPENGRTNVVTVPQAVYSGLESGHTYSVKVVPLNKAGIAGPAGTITGVTG
jgi:hypothetical protein